MGKPLNIKRILRNNPQVDRKLLLESERLSQELAKFGQAARPRRRLAAPFERKRAIVTRAFEIEL